MTGFSGRCLCEQVHYRCDADPMLAGHCHCVDCRKSSGSGHCTHVIIPETRFQAEGVLRWYDHPADSGHIVSRGFCPTCGCPIASRNSGMPGIVAVRASSLDDPEVARPRMIVYASRAPSWDVMDDALPCFPGAPDGGEAAAVAEALRPPGG